MTYPLFSIIVPCYSQASFLPQALDSICKQTFSEWEVIIVNDASPDDTLDVANSLASGDARIKVLDLPHNVGLPAARNEGIKNAIGTYILPLDADDIIAPDYLEKALKLFLKEPQTSLVYGKAMKFNDVKEWQWKLKSYSYENLLLGNIIYASAIFKRDCWQRIGGYDTSLVHGSEDWEFWIRLLNEQSIVHFIDSIVFYYRKKPDSMSKTLFSDPKKIAAVSHYIYQKHSEKYLRTFGTPHQVLRELVKLRNKKFNLHGVYQQISNSPLITNLQKLLRRRVH
jgi:glycosyltransferase involved in cell wall biosynthesis